MEATTTTVKGNNQEFKTQLHATELSSILDYYGSKVQTLSLDCFDTLLWRKTATPSDVFYDLQQQPLFKSLGFTANLRAQAESLARQKKLMKYGHTEVTLQDIYLASYPSLKPEDLNTLIEEELTSEIATCYAFPPIVDLMRDAHARGLKIIIVSDTYFTELQLRRLLESKLPSDVMAMIMKIFCSSDNGKSKSGGLFKDISEKLYSSTKSILHIGDHLIADYAAPQTLGVNTIQLLHHDRRISEMLRMQALSCGFMDTSIRHQRSLSSPFRGMLASANFSMDKPESAIGYASIGPIMYAFGKFICDEIATLKKSGKNPKILFLMRDAHLPALVCEALENAPVGKRVRISRFAAYASSFRTKEDVDRYVGDNVLSYRFYDMCKQLLLPEEISTPLIESATKSRSPAIDFIKLIQEKNILDIIFKESKIYRNRLYRHLENEIELKKGDTLVFVDLGYTGTAQIKLQPVFKEEMDVEILGRYLISLRTPQWENSRKGLLDPSWCDDRTMSMLVMYIALLEQICTSSERSVIDYDQDGNPIYADSQFSEQQYIKLENIQSECVRFALDAEKFFHKSGTSIEKNILRDTAMAELGRLLFLPTQTEINYLQSFKFDLNLGTNDLMNVFDQEKGLIGLRKRGLFFMEKNLKSMRTNYPAELRVAGLDLVLTLMAQHRIGFDIRVNDLSLRREKINIIVIRGNQSSQTTLEALPTHDGYFALLVPVGTGDFQIGVQFGLHYQWVQLESAELILTSALYGSKESDHTENAASNLATDQMIDKGNGLFECVSDTSLLVFAPSHSLGTHNYTLRIVFRPIVSKNKGSAN